MSDCLFCEIVNGKIPAKIVYEDNYCMVFEDISPQAPIHLLVIPKKHYSGIHQVPKQDEFILTNILKTLSKVVELKGLKKNGYRIVSNFGESAGQTVHHIHFHILSGRDFQWPPG